MIKISLIRHSWPDGPNFAINRAAGYDEYTFLHFFNSMNIELNGVTTVTQPNACIIFNKNTPQRFYSQSAIIHDWFHFSVTGENPVTKYGLEFDRLYYPHSSEFITSLTAEMESEFNYSGSYSNELINTKANELFMKLYRACFDEPRPSVDPDTEDRFNELRRAIFFDLSRHWTINEMADSVGLSRSRFFTVYKGLYGKTPNDDIINARIERAKNLLKSGGRTVSEISDKLGYNNVTHFMRQFKAITGTTPKSFKTSE